MHARPALPLAAATAVFFAGGIIVLKRAGKGSGGAASDPLVANVRCARVRLLLGCAARGIATEHMGVQCHARLRALSETLAASVRGIEDLERMASGSGAADATAPLRALALSLEVHAAANDMFDAILAAPEAYALAVEVAEHRDAVVSWATDVAFNIDLDTSRRL